MEIREMLPDDGPAADMLRRFGIDSPRDGSRRRARADAPPAGPAGERMGDEPMTDRPARRPVEDMSPEMRARVREIIEGMPQPDEVMTQIWKELSILIGMNK